MLMHTTPFPSSRISQLVRALLVCAVCAAEGRAQTTAFTYQGRLTDGSSTANGFYDLQFAIHDADSGGNIVAGSVVHPATPVSNGLFTVTLDFGAEPFDGAARWLEIAVRTNGVGAFSGLAPRQPLTAAPYAVTARNITGEISASQLSGTLDLGQLPTGC